MVVGADVVIGDVGSDDLDFLLGAALAAPEAARSPGAGMIVGSILTVLARRGADQLLERHIDLAAAGGTLEVTTYRLGSLEPPAVDGVATPGDGLRLMLSRSATGSSQELVRRQLDGSESVLAGRVEEGPLDYRLAETGGGPPGNDGSQPATVDDVVHAVRVALADTTIEVDLGGVEDVVTRALAAIEASPSAPPELPAPAPPVDEVVTLALVAFEASLNTALESSAPPPPPPPPTSEEIAGVLERRMAVVVQRALGTQQRRTPRMVIAPDEVASERLWLKFRSIAHRLRATGEALARLEAAVRRVDHSANDPSVLDPSVTAVVGPDLNHLRSQLARLDEALGLLNASGGSAGASLGTGDGQDLHQ